MTSASDDVTCTSLTCSEFIDLVEGRSLNIHTSLQLEGIEIKYAFDFHKMRKCYRERKTLKRKLSMETVQRSAGRLTRNDHCRVSPYNDTHLSFFCNVVILSVHISRCVDLVGFPTLSD